MTPLAAEMLQTYRAVMPAFKVTLRREGEADCQARARVVGLSPDELVGGIDQTVRSVIVLAEDVTFSTPLKRGDEMIMANGDLLRIEESDADKRSVDGTTIAFELVVKG